MAETYTSNLGLTKPDYDSPADISVINSNMDKIDNAVANAGKVKSVNNKTGDVTLTAADVGALPSDGTAVNANALNGKDAGYYETGLTVLWSNPSPSSTFAAQSIVLSDAVENYTFLIIECGRSTTNLSKIAGIFVVGYTSKQYLVFDEYRYRYVSGINGTNMTFGDSYDDSGSDNNRIVPTCVYGVKLGGA